jgi:hypothetical protein
LLIDAIDAVNNILFFIGARVSDVIGFIMAEIVCHFFTARNQAVINGNHRRDQRRWNRRSLAGCARSGTAQTLALKDISMK